MDGGRVEFPDAVDHEPGAADDVLELGEFDDDGPSGPRHWWWAVLGVAVVLVAAAVGVRVRTADPAVGPGPTAPVVAAPSRTTSTSPVLGQVDLPTSTGGTRELVTAGRGDVVWALDRGAGIVRLQGGRVTAVQLLEAQVTSLAVDPDGSRLYAGVAGDAPAVQEMDARTLALGAVLTTPVAPTAVTASEDTVWAVLSSQLWTLDPLSLQERSRADLPGVITVEHLRVVDDPAGGAPRLVALVTTDEDGGRLLSVDTTTGAVTIGPALSGSVSVASSPLLTWVTWTPPEAPAATTQGFSDVDVGGVARASAADLPGGSRLVDGGAGSAAFYAVRSGSPLISCRDSGGFEVGRVDLSRTVADSWVTGTVVRTDLAFYAVSSRGLLRTAVGDCP